MTDDGHPDASTATDPPHRSDAPVEADDQEPQPAALPPRRRWRAARRTSGRHPLALPIGAGFAGLLLGAGLTAATLNAFAPAGEPLNDAGAWRAMPPARVDQAPAPRAWPGPRTPNGAHPADDPPPPPPGWGPGAPPPPGPWGPPPPPAPPN